MMPITSVEVPDPFDEYIVFVEVPDPLTAILMRDLKPELRRRHVAASEKQRATTRKPTTKKRARHK